MVGLVVVRVIGDDLVEWSRESPHSQGISCEFFLSVPLRTGDQWMIIVGDHHHGESVSVSWCPWAVVEWLSVILVISN